jgi:hypothetical protein
MHIVKSVGVLSVANIFGLIYACLGLIFLPIFLLVGLVGGIAGDKAAFSSVVGVVLAFIMPIMYGVMGFVMGAIGAALHNLFAGWIGGIEIRTEPVARLEISGSVMPLAPSS